MSSKGMYHMLKHGYFRGNFAMKVVGFVGNDEWTTSPASTRGDHVVHHAPESCVGSG